MCVKVQTQFENAQTFKNIVEICDNTFPIQIYIFLETYNDENSAQVTEE